MGCATDSSRSFSGVAIRFVATAWALALAVMQSTPARADNPLTIADLDKLPIEDLAKIEISSVSKTAQPLGDAPAAIYVISHEDIVRSGSTSLPEILRLAPNLHVAQTTASQYVITARGFSGNPADQNFSDKLLVLIDGRSVYTPLYSGVYWDMQDVSPEDIDRIEVISGPGATLWGANAVDGVINMITRKSSETQGGVLNVGAGNLDRGVSLRYGGRIGDDLTYRVYAKDFIGADTVTSTGAGAHDRWTRPQGGFRFDWTPSSADLVTLQGDAYRGAEARLGMQDETIAGRNLLGRWNHTWQDGSALQVQAYYDRTERATDDNGGHFALDTYDLDVQHNFALGRRNAIVWGGGLRIDQYAIVGTAAYYFTPPSRTLNLANIFVQDSFSVSDTTKLILGLKLEDDPYSGAVLLPSARFSWKPNDATLLWAAASRAVRSPTPFDRDVAEKLGGRLFLVGGADFQPEKLTAYEIGARIQASSNISLSVSTFYNVYDDLRSLEINPRTLIPLRWGNKMRGETSGLEAWGDYRVKPWWRLSASFDLLSEHLTFEPGASHLLPGFGAVFPGVEQVGDDPKSQASLKSSMNLGREVTFDTDLRYVGPLPNPRVPSYVELNGRVGWNVSERVQLSLSGFNLLNGHHQEFPAPQANPVQRSFFAGLQWRF